MVERRHAVMLALVRIWACRLPRNVTPTGPSAVKKLVTGLDKYVFKLLVDACIERKFFLNSFNDIKIPGTLATSQLITRVLEILYSY
jgi:hypothetical protein